MKIKKLTVNGQTFLVNDGGAVRFDENQALTQEQKAQARENIGTDGAVAEVLLSCDLVPAFANGDGAVLAEADGTILLNL